MVALSSGMASASHAIRNRQSRSRVTHPRKVSSVDARVRGRLFLGCYCARLRGAHKKHYR
jgi:hypothetical protein